MPPFLHAFLCFQLHPSVDAVFSILTKLSSKNAAIHTIGKFPAYWKDLWASTVKYRPLFGTRPNRAQYDENGDMKRLMILEDLSNDYFIFDEFGNVPIDVKFQCEGIPDFTPFQLYQWSVANILQCYNMLRGGKEPASLTRHDFEFGIMKKGNFKGRPYCKLKLSHLNQKQNGGITVLKHTR